MIFKTKKLPYILLGLAIFIFMLIFFINIRPVVIFDGDDWTYISAFRHFAPELNAWNPARVLPETFMPLCGSIATFLVYPITGNYVGSFTIVFAIVIAAFIAVYITLFSKMISKLFSLKTSYSITISILFFLFHFLLFASESQNNYDLFLTTNATCYFFYLIPSLLNSIIVLYLIAHEDYDYSLKIDKPLKFGVLLVFIYAAIFSNLYCSIILGVFAGSKLLVSFCKEIKNKFNFFKFIKKYAILIGIIVAWLVSVYYELSGGRAKVVSSKPFWPLLSESIRNFLKTASGVQKSIAILFTIINIIFIIKFIIDIKNKKNREYISIFIQMLICIGVSAIYFMLLSSRVTPLYNIIPVYSFSFYLYVLIFEFMCLAYLIKEMPKIVIMLPFLIAYFLFDLNYSISTLYNGNAKVYKEISNDLLLQVKNAEKKGKSKVYLHVPEYDSTNNWPLPDFLGERMSVTLYKHKVINKPLEIEIVPDASYNDKYQIVVEKYGLEYKYENMNS